MPIATNALPEGVVPSINPRAKRLSLRADSRKGHIRLVIPPRCPDRKALEFTHSHRQWIETTLANMPQSEPLTHGALIPLLGTDREIVIIHHNKAQTDILITETQIRVMTRRNDPTRNILNFLKETAEHTMRPMVNDKAAKLGHFEPSLSLRDTKSRWGSCDGRRKKIMLCWRLVFAPIEIIDYVVAHEVAHLKHMDHSHRFWAQCQALCESDMQKSRQWLADNGARLLRIGH